MVSMNNDIILICRSSFFDYYTNIRLYNIIYICVFIYIFKVGNHTEHNSRILG